MGQVLFFLLIFYWSRVASNVVLVSGVQQNESAIHTHISPLLLDFLPIYGITDH